MWGKNLKIAVNLWLPSGPCVGKPYKEPGQDRRYKVYRPGDCGRHSHTCLSTHNAFQHRNIPMKTWIGVADGLLRRWEFECVLLGSTPSLVTYTYYDYNADIKIEPPTEAELLPRGIPGPPSLGPGSGGGIGRVPGRSRPRQRYKPRRASDES